MKLPLANWIRDGVGTRSILSKKKKIEFMVEELSEIVSLSRRTWLLHALLMLKVAQ